MKTQRSTVVDNGVVVFDETSFVECEFNGCEIRYSGGRFASSHTAFNNPKWVFTGAARNTIELLKVLGVLQGNPSDWKIAPQNPVFDSGDITE